MKVLWETRVTGHIAFIPLGDAMVRVDQIEAFFVNIVSVAVGTESRIHVRTIGGGEYDFTEERESFVERLVDAHTGQGVAS